MFVENTYRTQSKSRVAISETDLREFLAERGVLIPHDCKIEVSIPKLGTDADELVAVEWEDTTIDGEIIPVTTEMEVQ